MHSAIAKSLHGLSREKLLELCISWSKSSKCSPYLLSNRKIVETEEEDYLHVPAESRTDLKEIYTALEKDEAGFDGLSKRDIIDRIVDGDWRRGLSLDQLASIDFAFLEENDTALRWSALKLVPLSSDLSKPDESRPAKRRRTECYTDIRQIPRYPSTTPSLFVQRLMKHISPLIKAHYRIHRLKALGLSVVRLCITTNRPFAPLSTNVPSQSRATSDPTRVMYIALPDSCPYVYVSVAGSVTSRVACKKNTSKSAATRIDIAAAKRVVLEAIPKALSQPQQRWSLESTKLVVKSLHAMTLLRGSAQRGALSGPVSSLLPNDPTKSSGDNETTVVEQPWKYLTGQNDLLEYETTVETRFGNVNGASHAKLDRVQFRLHDVRNNQKQSSRGIGRSTKELVTDDPATMTITLSGTDVFAGLKHLALNHPHYVDLNKMPGLLTGEGNRTTITL